MCSVTIKKIVEARDSLQEESSEASGGQDASRSGRLLGSLHT